VRRSDSAPVSASHAPPRPPRRRVGLLFLQRERWLERRRLRPRFLRGTLAPARRASERPIAIACLRLFTFRLERPERSVPCFSSCIAFRTLLEAFLLYLLAMIVG
jgi:hypothetical protein